MCLCIYDLGVGEEWFQVELTDVEPLWNMPNLWHEKTWTDGEVSVQIILIDTEALDEDVCAKRLLFLMQFIHNDKIQK